MIRNIRKSPHGENASGASTDWKLETVPNITIGTNHLLPPSSSVTCYDLDGHLYDDFIFLQITNLRTP